MTEEKNTSGKNYWLKMRKDFFKRHDTRIIRGMPNGEKYLLFYLVLLAESVSHDGKLRFSEAVPYNEEMLAIVTETDVDTVRCAIHVFIELGMMEKWDDGTFFMSELQRMIGTETKWAEKKRLQRERQAALPAPEPSDEDGDGEGQCPPDVPSMSDKSKKKRESKIFVRPSLEEVRAYCLERKNNIDPEAFMDHYESNGWKIGGRSAMKDWKAAVRTWEKNSFQFNSRRGQERRPVIVKQDDKMCKKPGCDGVVFASRCKKCGALYDAFGGLLK